MPNWVNNDIIIKGNPASIQRFAKAVRSKDKDGEVNVFDFNNIFPCPEQLNKNDWQSDKAVAAANKATYGYEGWYDWNVANWGTKWNSCNARVCNLGNGSVCYSFETAWSPVADRILSNLSRRFKSLTFTHEFHEEAGMYPSERKVWQEGEITSQEEIPNTNIGNEEDEEQGEEVGGN
jgi:hypothetical protein